MAELCVVDRTNRREGARLPRGVEGRAEDLYPTSVRRLLRILGNSESNPNDASRDAWVPADV